MSVAIAALGRGLGGPVPWRPAAVAVASAGPGGGAGSAGVSGNAYQPGEGGVGVRLSHIPLSFGHNGFFAGGGAGGITQEGPGIVSGGLGGGGDQGPGDSVRDGQPGTGGGGAGGNGPGSPSTGGRGGGGVVIIYYDT